MADRRYALQPLCDALACSPDDLKRRLGLDRRQIALYLADGLSEARADQLAVKAGLPTHLVWPEMIDHAIEDATTACADPQCAAGFVPLRYGQKFCSPRCRNRHRKREANRRRWASDPEWRSRKLEANRRYQEASKRVRLLKQRKRYEANAERERAKRRARYAAQRSEAA